MYALSEGCWCGKATTRLAIQLLAGKLMWLSLVGPRLKAGTKIRAAARY